ncbi:MAG TPA: type ISP restriction/modification enzyme, partial [Chthonomonadales bacterium]|nr:type ISP restriction/modification enzyme [Chthonomonadales bacterium]
MKPVADEAGPCVDPVPCGFRSFDRQWIIPDNRVINRPNPTLWELRSERQVFLTAVDRTSPSAGPGCTFSGLVPDLDHYNGRGGRVYPLWSDAGASNPNIRPRMLKVLSERMQREVTADALFSYIAAVAAHPGFTTRFKNDLSMPGLRIPLAADRAIFEEAVELGRRVVWLHTFGERMANTAAGQPPGPPRLPPERAPFIPKEGAIPQDESGMPDSINYDPTLRRLHLGRGFIENVSPETWRYEVSGKQVLLQWFSYRRRNRERPIIGDRRPPSPLGDIQPEAWQAEYTSELLNVLHVLTLLVDLEPKQAALLEHICAGSILTNDELVAAGAFEL